MLLAASSQNGAAIPIAAMITPASAGPMLRLTLIPALFNANADRKSDFGTSCGRIACQAGATSAAPVLIRNVKRSNRIGVTKPSDMIVARIAVRTVTPASTTNSKRRRSTMSARAPAGRANRNSGRAAATCTSDTTEGLGSSSVISQPAAVSCIHEPIFEMTVATQIQAKAALRNGLQGDGLISRLPAPKPPSLFPPRLTGALLGSLCIDQIIVGVASDLCHFPLPGRVIRHIPGQMR
jgi:hypothetical protein